MASSPHSTGREGAAALIAQAKSEGVWLSVDPSGGLRCVGRMSPQLRAGLLSSKKLVLRVLRPGAPEIDTRRDQGALVPGDHGPLPDRLEDAAEALAEASILESRQEPSERTLPRAIVSHHTHALSRANRQVDSRKDGTVGVGLAQAAAVDDGHSAERVAARKRAVVA